jgi:WhiB family redox-sensing transcriptional regulator
MGPGDNWADWAACRGSDPEIFFPEPLQNPGNTEKERYAAALSKAQGICAECPVQADCLAEAEANEETWGIWGGKDFSLTKRQRAELRKAATELKRAGKAA